MNSVIKEDDLKSGDFPNDLTHGLLCKHCGFLGRNRDCNETTSIGRTTEGDQVKFPESNSTFKVFNGMEGSVIYMNDYLSNWNVWHIEDEEETGYFGVTYVNKISKQLVLAHAATNFKRSLTKLMLKKSGVHQDIEGILLGNILLHQAHGFVATEKVVGLIKETFQDFTLTFTGHSLGAWLAELSVFYSHDTFKYPCVRAVTFDGPGSFEMMKKMLEGEIKGPQDKVRLEELDIVSYLSAPNVVNCTNKHVGKVYRIFPYNLKEKVMKKLPSWCSDNPITSTLFSYGAIVANAGHYLEFILCTFNPYTGKPTECKQVVKWPVITTNFTKEFSSTLNTSSFTNILTQIPTLTMVREGAQVIVNGVSKVFNYNNSTLGSICHLISILWNGEIKFEQFFLAHEYLDPKRGFREFKMLPPVKKFFLQYKAQYEVIDVDYWSKKVTDNPIDNCLVQLSKYSLNVQGVALRRIVSMYSFNTVERKITINEKHQSDVTVDYVFNRISNLWNRDTDFRDYVANIHKPRLKENLGTVDIQNNTAIEDIKANSAGRNIFILKGISGCGKTTLAKTYGKKYEHEFTTRILNCSSENHITQSVEECVENLRESIQHCGTNLDFLRDHLSATKQKVCFVLDNVSNALNINSILEKFSKLCNILFIITTENDNLYISKDQKEKFVETPPAMYEFLRKTVRTNVNSLLDKEQVTNLSVFKLRQHFINSVALVKSETLSVCELVTCLSNSEYLKDDVEAFLFDLRRFSFLTVDKNLLVKVNRIFQNVAQEYFNCTSSIDFVRLMLPFRYKCVLTEFVLQTLFKCTLAEIRDVSAKDWASNLEDAKCNFGTFVGRLLKDVQNKKYEFDNADTLIEILKELQKVADQILQLEMESLSNEWSAVNMQGDKRIEFLQFTRGKISDFVKLFTNFGSSVKEECERQNLGWEFSPDDKHVLLLGPTGSGKSTVLNYLIGNELNCTEVGRHGNRCTIEVARSGEKVFAQIGKKNASQSQTSFITPYPTGNVIYWDFPGFFDTHGEVQRLKNAFSLKYFSKTVSMVKIIIVVEGASLDVTYGHNFRSFFSVFGKLCSPELLKYNCCFMITKCASFESETQRHEDKIYYLGKFKELLSGSSFVHILGDSSVLNRMALFPKINTIGVIHKDIFQDLESALESISPSNVFFNFNTDDTTYRTMENLANLLNAFAVFNIQNVIDGKINDIISTIQSISFTKIELQTKLKKIATSRDNANNFVSQLNGFLIRDDEKVLGIVLQSITDAFHFLSGLDSNLRPDLSTWAETLDDFNEKCDKILWEPIRNATEGVIRIEAPILSSADLSSIKLPGVNIIEAIALICVIDEDVILPGVTLLISAQELRIIGDRKVSLKPDGTNEIKNAGSFYAYVKSIKGGNILLYLNGLEGSPGRFSTSGNLRSLIESLECEIGQLTSIQLAIDEIKPFTKDILVYFMCELKIKQKEIQQRLENLVEISSEISRITSNPLSSDENANRGMIQQLEIDCQAEICRLENIQQKIAELEKLHKLVNIQNEYEQLCAYDLGQTEYLCEPDEHSLRSSIQQAFNEIKQIEESLTAEIDDECKFREILEQLKTIHKNLSNFPKQLQPEYLAHKEKLLTAEKRTLEMHTISVDGFDFELSPQEFHDIVRNRSTKKKSLQAQKTELRSKINTLKQLITSGEIGVDKFEELHKKRKMCQVEREKKLGALVESQNHLKKYPEFFQIKDKIEQILAATENMDRSSRNWNSLVAKSEVIFPHSKNRKYFPRKNEILGNIEENAYNKLCEKHFENKLESKGNKNNVISLLKEYMSVRVHLKLFDIKTAYNSKVDKYQKISKSSKFELNDPDFKTLEANFEYVCRRVDGWVTSSDIRNNLQSNSSKESIDTLDMFVIEQYPIQKDHEERLGFANRHQNELRDALQKFQSAKNEYKEAKKCFTEWRQIEKKNDNKIAKQFIEAYEMFQLCDDEFSALFKEEAKIARELLLKQGTLIRRIERRKDDRHWVSNVFRSVLKFNQEFYEKYQLTGSEGTQGGNSGAFYCPNGSSHFQVSDDPGKGGEHALLLEGTCTSEFSMASSNFNIGSLSEVAQLVERGYIPSVSFVSDMLLTSRAALESSGASSTLGSSADDLLMSPCIGTTFSGWIDGPCLTYPGSAKDGEKGYVDSNALCKCETNLEVYLQHRPEELLTFFKPSS